LEFVAEDAEPEWPQEKLDSILNDLKQGNLFEDQNLEDFKVMPKLPYKFSFRFKDDVSVESKLMIEDWEIGQLYWNCLKRYGKGQACRPKSGKNIWTTCQNESPVAQTVPDPKTSTFS